MYNINKYKYLLLGAMSFAANAVFAQGGINDNQDVVTALSTNITLLEKVQFAPVPFSVADTSRALAEPVSVPPRLLTLKYDAPTIRPIALKKTPPKPDYKFWAKAGYGIPNQPYAELSYQSKTVPRGYFGAYGKYHSADNSALVNQRFNQLLAQLSGTYFIDSVAAVQARGGYAQDVVNFYGYKHDSTSFTKEQTAQYFSKIFVNADIFNTIKNDADFHYKGGLNFYNLQANYKAAETGVVAQVAISKYFAEKHPFNFIINNDFTAYNQADTAKFNNNLLSMLPSFTFHQDAFKAKIGANIQLPSGARFQVSPDVELAYAINEAAVVFGGWQGAVRKNTFATLSTTNPYIVSKPDFKNTKTEDRFIGVKGKVDAITYELKAYNQVNDNLALFLNSAADNRRFAPVYDTVSVWGGHLGLGFKPTNDLELSFGGDYRAFKALRQAKAWHLPDFEGNLGAKYHFSKEFEAHLLGFTAIGANAQDKNLKTIVLPAMFDVNVGASYSISDNFGVFLDLNNVLNQKYQRWNNYQSYGFNLIGGVTMKFK
jgi:hypothetical protein